MSILAGLHRVRIDQTVAGVAGALLGSGYGVRYFFALVAAVYFWALGRVAEGMATLSGIYGLIAIYALLIGGLHVASVLRVLPSWVGRSLTLLDAPAIGLIVAHDPNPQVPLQLLWLVGMLDHGMRFGLRGYLVAGVGFVLAAAFFLVLRAAYFDAPTDPAALWLLLLVAASALYGLRLIAERDRADDRARDAQARIALTVEALGIGIWRYDYETGLLDWDANTQRLAGLVPGSFSGRFGDFLRMLKAGDAERVQRMTAEALANGTPWEQEYEVIWPDGSEHLISSRGIVDRETGDRPRQMVGVSWDTTHMRRDYRTMVEASARAGTAAAVAGIGYWSLHLDGNRVDADAQTLRFFGLPQEPATRSYEDFVSRIGEGDRGAVNGLLRQTIEQGVPFRAEYRAHRPDGEERVIRAAGQAVRVPGQSGQGSIIGAAIDVTRERRDQSQLRAAVERLRSFSESARVGSWRYDVADGTVRLDDRLEVMFGFAPANASYDVERILERVHPDDRESLLAYFRALVEGGDTISLEHRAVWPDGSVHRMLARGVVERDGQGAAVTLRGATIDISRLESAVATQEQIS